MAGIDLLLKGGVVVNPAQGINAVLDVAVKDSKVAEIAPEIAEENAEKVIDAAGCIVVPGLIDLHSHVYWKGTSIGVDSDQLGTATGVTTFVDAGSAGAGTFEGFRSFVIARTSCDIFVFLNISFGGIQSNLNAILKGRFAYVWGEGDLKLLDAEEAIEVAQRYPEIIRGIKVRIGYEICGLDALRIAKMAAAAIGKPVMVHVSSPPPAMTEVLPLLENGDILTHAFRGFPNCLVDSRGKLLPEARDARDRGVIFDIGHGYGSFSFKTAQLLLDQGFLPDVISTDVHSLSINGPVYDLPTTMSKFLNLGMDLIDVITAVTSAPASAIGLANKGYGSIGRNRNADIAVLKLEKGEFEFKDAFGNTMLGDQRLTPVFTILKGKMYKKKGG